MIKNRLDSVQKKKNKSDLEKDELRFLSFEFFFAHFLPPSSWGPPSAPGGPPGGRSPHFEKHCWSIFQVYRHAACFCWWISSY